jgi:hypothetical protein
MMEKKSLLQSVIVLCLCLFGGHLQAALFDRGGGLIYDSDQNLTWLQDIQLSQKDGIGSTDWQSAVDWASNLSYYDSVRNVYWDNWRLPRAFVQYDIPLDVQYDPTGANSELGYMYYVNLGLDAIETHNPTDPKHTETDTNPFINWTNRGTWTETPSTNFNNMAYYFHTHFGSLELDGNGTGSTQRVWAVMDGDVSPVPVPPALALMLSGLALFRFFSGKRKTQH